MLNFGTCKAGSKFSYPFIVIDAAVRIAILSLWLAVYNVDLAGH